MSTQAQDLHFRTEADSLGSLSLPKTALYGINTARSRVNFPITGRSVGDCRPLVRAMAMVKNAAALANHDIGALDRDVARAIGLACENMAAGDHDADLVCDILEGSGGTSINMNFNEVIANAALLQLGEFPGRYERVHPNDHVNLSQSTNDVVPSAIKLAVHGDLGSTLAALSRLVEALAVKRQAFASVLRLGRTCLQDAQPMTLGQAFGGYEAVMRRHVAQLVSIRADLLTLPLGGTAIGTGFGVRPGYRGAVFAHLEALSGEEVTPCADGFDGIQNMDVCARLSSELRLTANSLWKLGNDLIILSSGPAGGLGEVALPAVQAGSSIMPGKVNPVIPMALCQVALAVNGNDLAVGLAAQQGLLDLNHYEMLIADRLFDSITMLRGAVNSFTDLCIEGLQVDERRSWQNLSSSSALATALVPSLGYGEVTALVEEAERNGRTFVEIAIAHGHLAQEDVHRVLTQAALSPEALFDVRPPRPAGKDAK